jgi:predicted metal-binding membrane protein
MVPLAAARRRLAEQEAPIPHLTLRTAAVVVVVVVGVTTSAWGLLVAGAVDMVAVAVAVGTELRGPQAPRA